MMDISLKELVLVVVIAALSFTAGLGWLTVWQVSVVLDGTRAENAEAWNMVQELRATVAALGGGEEF